jgi:hypothetical protein
VVANVADMADEHEKSASITTISEGSFDHVYRIEGGLIVRMDIQDVGTEDRVPIQAQVPE